MEGAHISLGAYGIVYGSTYHGAAGSIDSKTQLAVLPQFFSTWSLPKYNLTLGLGTYSPYGLREWNGRRNSPFSAQGETGEIDYFTLNPVVACQILPSLSIAAGPTLNYSEADFKEFARPRSRDFVNHFRGRDTAAGFNAGILWHPWAQHSFGITYRSATDMNYNGHATALVPPFRPISGPKPISISRNRLRSVIPSGPTPIGILKPTPTWTDWTDLRTVHVNPQAAAGDMLGLQLASELDV